MDNNEYSDMELAEERVYTLAEILEIEAKGFSLGYKKACDDMKDVLEGQR